MESCGSRRAKAVPCCIGRHIVVAVKNTSSSHSILIAVVSVIGIEYPVKLKSMPVEIAIAVTISIVKCRPIISVRKIPASLEVSVPSLSGTTRILPALINPALLDIPATVPVSGNSFGIPSRDALPLQGMSSALHLLILFLGTKAFAHCSLGGHFSVQSLYFLGAELLCRCLHPQSGDDRQGRQDHCCFFHRYFFHHCSFGM